ncbi:MAG: AMP-binding protein [Odoribacteraceae bacterium]|jgi:O-succinylbenzoic acid--CoA ligase|nr:AMP-binding protein [Odoribacteraceae bacterium]
MLDLSAFLAEWENDEDFVAGHTSGTTGAPRPIRLLKADMLASATLTNSFFGITSSSALLLCLSPDHIAGKMMIVRAAAAGAKLVTITPGSDPLATLDEPVDLAALVPLQLENSLRRPDKLSLVRQLLIGGAPLSPALEQRARAMSTPCFASYGMTETLSHVALRRVNETLASPLYTAIGDTRFSADSRGCLLVDAPHLRQRHFVTNDLVRLVDPSRFQWLGRVDNIINSGGIKLSPESLEATIAPLFTSRFFITAEDDPRLGQRLILLIEAPPWPPEEIALLRTRIALLLPPRERPRSVGFLPSFPETPSGKLIRTFNPADAGLFALL